MRYNLLNLTQYFASVASFAAGSIFSLDIIRAQDRPIGGAAVWIEQLSLVSKQPFQTCSGDDFMQIDPCGEEFGKLLSNQDRGPATLFQWGCTAEQTNAKDLDEPLVTDRPDFTEASTTVGRGVLQIESGYTFSSDDDGTVTSRSHSYPETLFRYGILADWLEFRLAWNYASEETAGVKQEGTEDLYLGLKLAMTEQDGLLPEMALVPQMTVPTGATAFSAGKTLPGVNWLYGWDVNESIATGGSTQFNRTIDDGTNETYTEWAQSWTVGCSLFEKVGAYTEWFAFFPENADTASTEHYFNGGLTYQLNNDTQFDVRAGKGLNDAADDYFIGTGVSIRLR